MDDIKVARKSLKRARVSCDGYKNCLLQVIAHGWNPKDNLDIVIKMDEAMDNFIKCSDDVIVLYDEGGNDEQKEIDDKDNTLTEYLSVLNKFKEYKKNFKSNEDKCAKYSTSNSEKLENSLPFLENDNDNKINPLKIDYKEEAIEPQVKLEEKHSDDKSKVPDIPLWTKEDAEVIKCGLCEKDSIGKYEFQKHLETHEQYPCDICSFQTKTKKHLQQHLNNHRKRIPSNCSLCAKQFSCKRTLERHIQSCNEEKIKRKKIIKECDQCEYSSSFYHNVKRHIERMHVNVKEPPKRNCDYCDYSSRQPSHLKRHMECCSKIIERKINLAEQRKCKSCDYFSLRPSDVRKHMKRCQNILERKERRKIKNTEHICKNCGKSFKNRSAVEIHEYSHAKKPEEAVQCKICLNFIKNQEFLENHLKNHSEFEQSYQHLTTI